jgi:hypothetical protein
MAKIKIPKYKTEKDRIMWENVMQLARKLNSG